MRTQRGHRSWCGLRYGLWYGLWMWCSVYVSPMAFATEHPTQQRLASKQVIPGEYMLQFAKPHALAGSSAWKQLSTEVQVQTFQSLPGWVHVKGVSPDAWRDFVDAQGEDLLSWEPVYRVYAWEGVGEPAGGVGGWGVNGKADGEADGPWDSVLEDMEFTDQWGLENPKDTDVDVKAAWALTQGKSNVVVAVLDSGADLTHIDLQPALWVNPGEIPGNGIDDDHNGYIDDLHGWNFVAQTASPQDDHGHGSHCAGIIAGAGHRVYGVAPKVRIMPLKFLAADGSGSTAQAVAAIDYALMMGAQVLNNSWGGGDYSQALEAAMGRSAAKGVVFVAAAGNSGVNIETTPMYPAAYKVAHVIAVANIDEGGLLSRSSNYGPKAVLLAAPGTGILSTYKRHGYAKLSGTSMAAPFVSGAAALALSLAPKITPLQIQKAMAASAKKTSALAQKVQTEGFLKIGRMLELIKADFPPSPPSEELDVDRLTFKKEATKKWYQVAYRVSLDIQGDQTSRIAQLTYTYTGMDVSKPESVTLVPGVWSHVFKTQNPHLPVKVKMMTKDHKYYEKSF